MNRRTFFGRLAGVAAAMGIGSRVVKAEKTWDREYVSRDFTSHLPADVGETPKPGYYSIEYVIETVEYPVSNSAGEQITINVDVPRYRIVEIRDVTDPANPIVISKS